MSRGEGGGEFSRWKASRRVEAGADRRPRAAALAGSLARRARRATAERKLWRTSRPLSSSLFTHSCTTRQGQHSPCTPPSDCADFLPPPSSPVSPFSLGLIAAPRPRVVTSSPLSSAAPHARTAHSLTPTTGAFAPQASHSLGDPSPDALLLLFHPLPELHHVAADPLRQALERRRLPPPRLRVRAIASALLPPTRDLTRVPPLQHLAVRPGRGRRTRHGLAYRPGCPRVLTSLPHLHRTPSRSRSRLATATSTLPR